MSIRVRTLVSLAEEELLKYDTLLNQQTTPQPRNPRRNPDDDEFDRDRDRRAGAGALEEDEDRERAGWLRKPRPKPPAGWRSFRPVPSRASKPDKHAL